MSFVRFISSQNGCGRQTNGSSGDYLKEEEETGGELRREDQGGCQVKGETLKSGKFILLFKLSLDA